MSEIFTAVKVLRGLPDLNPMQTSTVSMSQKLAAPLQNTEVTEQAGSFETYANTNNTIRCRKPEEDTLCSCDGVVVTSLLLMCIICYHIFNLKIYLVFEVSIAFFDGN